MRPIGLYASSNYRHPLANLFLSLAPAFLHLNDHRRMRFSSRLTQLQTLIFVGKIPNGTQSTPPVPQLFWLRECVNSRSRNIFNGLLLVPVNGKIPALNSMAQFVNYKGRGISTSYAPGIRLRPKARRFPSRGGIQYLTKIVAGKNSGALLLTIQRLRAMARPQRQRFVYRIARLAA